MGNFGDLLIPIKDNLLGYDLLIILVAICNFGYFLYTLKQTDKEVVFWKKQYPFTRQI